MLQKAHIPNTVISLRQPPFVSTAAPPTPNLVSDFNENKVELNGGNINSSLQTVDELRARTKRQLKKVQYQSQI